MTSQDPSDSAPAHGGEWERLATSATELAAAIRTAQGRDAERLVQLEQDTQRAKDQVRDQALALEEAVRARQDAEATRRLASEEAERLRRSLEETSSQRDHERTSALELRSRVAAMEKELGGRTAATFDSFEAEALKQSLAEARTLLEDKAATLTETLRKLEAAEATNREAVAEIETLRRRALEVSAERDTERALVADLRARAEASAPDTSLATELAAARQALADAEARLSEEAAAHGDSHKAILEAQGSRDVLEEQNRQAVAKTEALQRDLDDVTAERDLERGAAAELRSRLEAKGAETGGADETSRQLAEARQSLSAALALVTEKDAEVAALRAETQDELARLRREIEEAKAARKGAEDARALAAADADALRRQIESERLKADAERKAFVEESRKEHDQVLATAASMRTSARNEREALAARLQALEAQVEAQSTRTESAETAFAQTVDTVRGAVQTLRRTPFVPPALRIAIDAIEPMVAVPGAPRPNAEGRGHRILLLDRDTFGLDAVATELEAGGHHPLVAHFAEEVSFFFKTPEARRVGVAVCDVMALRSDQDLGALVRAWRQDVPHLAVFVTYNGESPMETDRAQRLSLAAALPLLRRPLAAGALVEAISSHIRRQGTSNPPRPS